jgi:hypothetical protein
VSGRPTARIAALGALLAAGCGGTDTPPVATSCTDPPATITRALDAAPGTVTLPDGARLSECIRNARSEAQLQNVGIAFSNAAEDLEAQAAGDPRTALELGYLVGATRSGARTGSGVQDELVRRIERSAALAGASPAVVDALNEGIAAGEARG